MAKWFKEHLGFKTTKAPPPAPPKPDYRHCHTGVPTAPGFQQTSSGVTFPNPAQPDIVAAYKLQKELDFEDPYSTGANISFGTTSNTSPDIKYVSPKHRLIKVETVEKSSPAPGGGVTVAQTVAVSSVKSPTSPAPEHDNKEKVGESGRSFCTCTKAKLQKVVQLEGGKKKKKLKTFLITITCIYLLKPFILHMMSIAPNI